MASSILSRPPSRRVVITGMGAMTPLGNTFVDSWKALLTPSSNGGATTLTDALVKWQHLPAEQLEHELTIAQLLPCQVAAPVQCHDVSVQYDARTPRFVQFALQAAQEALLQAGLLHVDNINNSQSVGSASLQDVVTVTVNPQRMGVCIGSGMSGVREIVHAAHTIDSRQSIRRLSPYFVPKVLVNAAASRVSLQYGLQGPNHAVSTACAAGTHALGDALRCIEWGNADIMIAGGAEACLDPWSMAGFCRLKALSTNYNETPDQASRPFDKDRDGFVMGEGAALLVLEELEHAKQRGAEHTILAEVAGYGLSGDAYHITAPDPQGRGAEQAMVMALQQAAALDDLDYNQLVASIGYVNAHATSTPMGDEIEAQCIHRIFKDSTRSNSDHHNPMLYVSSTKGATGHLLGAAGAIEAAFTVQSLVEQIIPPTHNLHALAEDEQESLNAFQHVFHNQPIDLKKDNQHHATMQYAMNNSFGFGGTNASIVLKRYVHDDK